MQTLMYDYISDDIIEVDDVSTKIGELSSSPNAVNIIEVKLFFNKKSSYVDRMVDSYIKNKTNIHIEKLNIFLGGCIIKSYTSNGHSIEITLQSDYVLVSNFGGYKIYYRDLKINQLIG